MQTPDDHRTLREAVLQNHALQLEHHLRCGSLSPCLLACMRVLTADAVRLQAMLEGQADPFQVGEHTCQALRPVSAFYVLRRTLPVVTALHSLTSPKLLQVEARDEGGHMKNMLLSYLLPMRESHKACTERCRRDGTPGFSQASALFAQGQLAILDASIEKSKEL